MRATPRKLLNVFLSVVLLLAVYNLTITTRRAPKQPLLQSWELLQSASGPGRKADHIASNAVSKGANSAFHVGPYFHYPVSSFIPLPTGSPIDVPKIQYNFKPEGVAVRAVREKRLSLVKEALVHSWQGYRKHAWLYDEVAPVSGGYRTTFGGWAASLVDSLDTLWITGMHEEFAEAVAAAARINFNTTEHLPLNVFETTIRYLGGFLGAYDVSNEKYPVLLQKAIEVGEVGD
jgi:Glycosyl hydrolase family 47